MQDFLWIARSDKAFIYQIIKYHVSFGKVTAENRSIKIVGLPVKLK